MLRKQEKKKKKCNAGVLGEKSEWDENLFWHGPINSVETRKKVNCCYETVVKKTKKNLK